MKRRCAVITAIVAGVAMFLTGVYLLTLNRYSPDEQAEIDRRLREVTRQPKRRGKET
jgi:amino acid permease